MIYVGIDAGSRAVKIAIIDAETAEIIAMASCNQGVEQDFLATRLLDKMLEENNLSRKDIAYVVATGYARNIIKLANTTITEITCHARGVHACSPSARTVIEIGGQDSKILHLTPDGTVQDFAMNDRCAAGTGRFLEVVAERLEVDLAHLGEFAARSQNPASISSMCVVFAETEIIGLLSSGVSREDIVAGVQISIVSRLATMAGRRVHEPVMFTGGVARVSGMEEALSKVLERQVTVVDHPKYTGALGAALLAKQKNGSSKKP